MDYSLLYVTVQNWHNKDNQHICYSSKYNKAWYYRFKIKISCYYNVKLLLVIIDDQKKFNIIAIELVLCKKLY